MRFPHLGAAVNCGAKRKNGGEGGIRTPGRVAPTLVFETSPFSRSGTSPRGLSGLRILLDRGAFSTQTTEELAEKLGTLFRHQPFADLAAVIQPSIQRQLGQ